MNNIYLLPDLISLTNRRIALAYAHARVDVDIYFIYFTLLYFVHFLVRNALLNVLSSEEIPLKTHFFGRNTT